MLVNDLHTAKGYSVALELQGIVIDFLNNMIESLHEYRQEKEDGYSIFKSDKIFIRTSLFRDATFCAYSAGKIIDKANDVHFKQELIDSAQQQHKRMVDFVKRLEALDQWQIIDNDDFYAELQKASDLASKLRRFMRDQEEAHIQSTSYGVLDKVRRAVQDTEEKLQVVPVVFTLARTDEKNFDSYFQLMNNPAYFSDMVDNLKKVSEDIRSISDSLLSSDAYEHYSPAADMSRSGWYDIRDISNRILTIVVNIEANIDHTSSDTYDPEDEDDYLRGNADIIKYACAEIVSTIVELKDRLDTQQKKYWDMIKPSE